MFGWFHLKLTTNDSNAVDFKEVIAQVETDENHWAQAGSFVRTNFNRASSCATKNAENKYDYKPASYATDPFMTVTSSDCCGLNAMYKTYTIMIHSTCRLNKCSYEERTPRKRSTSGMLNWSFPCVTSTTRTMLCIFGKATVK